MSSKLKELFDNQFLRLMGVFSIGFLMSYLLIQDHKVLEGVDKVEFSRIENLIRGDFQNLDLKYNINFKLVRKKEELILRIWDQNFFSINGWRLSPEGRDLISEISKSLQKIETGVVFEVSGHYDSIDPRLGKNLKEKKTALANKISVSTYRAAEVAEVLSEKGLDPELLSIKGYGDQKPLFKDRDRYGQYIAQAGELNRRLEISVKSRAGDRR